MTLCLIFKMFILKIAEITIIPTGFTIQLHLQPSSQIVEDS